MELSLKEVFRALAFDPALQLRHWEMASASGWWVEDLCREGKRIQSGALRMTSLCLLGGGGCAAILAASRSTTLLSSHPPTPGRLVELSLKEVFRALAFDPALQLRHWEMASASGWWVEDLCLKNIYLYIFIYLLTIYPISDTYAAVSEQTMCSLLLHGTALGRIFVAVGKGVIRALTEARAHCDPHLDPTSDQRLCRPQ